MQQLKLVTLGSVAEEMGAKPIMNISLHQWDGAQKSLFIIKNTVSEKIALLTEAWFSPINFNTPLGKQIWLHWWWLIQWHNIIVADEGLTGSVGIYNFEWTPVSISLHTSLNATEVFFRFRKWALQVVDGNPLLLHPIFPTLAHMPAFGSA